MADNPFAKYAPASEPEVNPFAKYVAPAPEPSGVPGPRRSYAASEVPVEAVKNIPRSAKQFATNLYDAITSPIETASAVLDIGAGALQNVLPDPVVNFINRFNANPAAADRAVKAANAVGGMYKERYGSYEGVKRTLAEDPVGFAADMSTLLAAGSTLTGRAAPAASVALGRAATLTNPLTPVVKTAQFAIEQKRKVLPSALQAEQQANAVRDATLAAGQKEGYQVTPGSISPTGKNILAERMAGKTHLEQLASVNNQAVTDRLARRAVGLPENTPLTPEGMRQIRADEYAKGYEPINKIGRITTDDNFLDDLAQVETNYAGAAASFPGAVPEAVEKLVKTYTVGQFDSADALKASRTLRDDAKASFKRGDNDLAKAQVAVSNALENQIERSLSAGGKDAAKMLEQFRLSRQRMAVSHTIEDAIREGSGSVTAAKLARDIQSGKYVSGDVKTIAEFANVFPRVMQTTSQIGTPAAGALLGRSLGGGIGLGVGGFLGGNVGAGAGAVIGSAAPEVISAAMRNYLLNKNMAPQYTTFSERLASDKAARNALMLQEARELQQSRNALAQ